MNRTYIFKQILLAVLAVSFCFCLATNNCLAQDQETKGATLEVKTDKRPPKKAGYLTASGNKKQSYRVVKASKRNNNSGRSTGSKIKVSPKTKETNTKSQPVKTAEMVETAQIGLTFWLHQPGKGENDAKGLGKRKENNGHSASEDTWMRIESDSILEPGDKVKISVESLSHSGYLYIIDHEQYADGSFGEPKLIYPTADIRSNYISPGSLIITDEFIVENWGEKQLKGDYLTVIISPKVLIERAQLKVDYISISQDQPALWEKNLSNDITIGELNGGAKQVMTEVEKEASKGLGKASLTQGDPLPQTLYQMNIKSGETIVIRVPLKYKPS